MIFNVIGSTLYRADRHTLYDIFLQIQEYEHNGHRTDNTVCHNGRIQAVCAHIRLRILNNDFDIHFKLRHQVLNRVQMGAELINIQVRRTPVVPIAKRHQDGTGCKRGH